MPFFLRLREAHSSVPHSQVCSQPPPPAPAATPRCPATAPEAAAGAAGASTGRMKHRRHFQPSAAARRQNAEGLRAASGGEHSSARPGPARHRVALRAGGSAPCWRQRARRLPPQQVPVGGGAGSAPALPVTPSSMSVCWEGDA